MNHIPNEELAKEIALAVKTSDGKIETINKILHLIKPLMKKGIPDIATLEYLKIKYGISPDFIRVKGNMNLRIGINYNNTGYVIDNE